MKTIGRLRRILSATVLVAAIALLLDATPSVPTTDALNSASRINELFVFVAWLGCLLLALGLLYRTATRTRSAPPLSIPRIPHLHPNPKRTPSPTAAYSSHAFPLILRRPPSPIEHSPLGADAGAADGPTAAFAGALQKRAEATASISLLGPLTISGRRKQLRRPRGPTKELLCYLALHPSGAHRDAITDALWPDQSPEQGRRRLWRAAGDARAHFGETILTREGEHYRLDRTQVAIDLDDLDELLAELEHTERADEQLPLLEQALTLYTGEPLAGGDFPWAENDQRRLHAIQLDLLERAGRARLATGDPAGALANAEAGLGYEPYNEKLARLAMQAEAALGLRGAVINRFEQLGQLLDEQLGLQPHRETRVLYRQLLSQDQHQAAPLSSRASSA